MKNWRIDISHGDHTTVRDDKDIIIADVWGDIGKSFPSDKEMEENARLIAAAPELLKALEQIRDFDPEESDYDDPGQIAIEAINKAKGIIK